MSKEIKEKKSKAGIITAIAVAVIVIVGGVVLFKSSNNNSKPQEQKVATATTAPQPKEEKTVARIDISTKLVDAKKPQFEVYVDASKKPINQSGWMAKHDTLGYVVQKSSGKTDIVVKVLKDADIDLSLLGKHVRDENNKIVKKWVKFTSVKVNGKEILSEPVSVYLKKPFHHIIEAKAGEEYKIQAKWTKADK